MSNRTMLYSGIVIPGNIVAQIEEKAAAEHPEFREHAGAFEVGGLMAYCGRMPVLGTAGARAEAFRNGQIFGASLRSIRCHACKGRGVTECGTFVCPECDGTGEEARDISEAIASMREQMHVRTESIRASLEADIEASLGRFGVRGVVHAVEIGGAS